MFIRVALTDLDTGVVTLLDDWRLGMEVGAFSGTARPGTYRVTAQRNYVDGAPELPSGQVLLASSLTIAGPTSDLALDVATVPVSGVVTVNGGKLTLGTVDFASDVFIRVALTDVETGVVTMLDDWHLGMEVGAFSGTARPGTYRVTAQRNYVDGAPELPSGQVLLASSLTISGPTGDIALDVPTVPVSGVVTANGAKLTLGTVDFASDVFIRVALTDVETGVVTMLDDWHLGMEVGAFSGTARPGTYRVTAQRNYVDGAPELPSGQVLLASSLTISGPTGDIALDVPTVPVSGVVTANGAKLTLGTVEFASDVFIRVRLTDVATGVVTFLDDWHLGMAVGAFAGVVRPGTYRVTVGRNYADGAPELPSGEALMIDAIAL